ncbi:hypothetical protein [Streptomyces subrutilus]|uniref:Uncharacterized protein n=1 Tax=Streptomyces subrutilus TaxID=36818 RepID=A0A1E5PKJ2_9ACTN|nr:hypothetical protein [Streptomyces subrutilus]OEJ30081.1 hypothetical protein BGK67_00660 [Streptomyces subrutilus]
MNMYDPPDDAGEFDVLGVYLEALRAQMSPPRFRTLVAAVQETCGLLSDGKSAQVTVPGDGFLPSDLRREYLSVLAIMITGRMDHRLVEVLGPGGTSGWVVLEAGAEYAAAAVTAVRHTVTRRHDE